jgi:general secretion pathway protein I
VRSRAHNRGFTLLELVAAFAIFAIGVGIALQIATGAMGMARRSATYTHAALLAQSKLDELGWGAELEEGSDSGEFDDKYRWEISVAKMDPPMTESGTTEEIPVDLMRVELVVRWEEGRAAREAKFVTMRAINPGTNSMVPGVPPIEGGSR